jgi:hypothetical protein
VKNSLVKKDPLAITLQPPGNISSSEEFSGEKFFPKQPLTVVEKKP